MTAILIIEDHAIVRDGLRRLFSARPDLTIDESANATSAIAQLKRRKFELILLDLNLPDLSGLEALRRIRQAAPETSILVFSMHDEPVYVVRTMEAGASGYISKSAPPEEILAAADTILAGGSYLEKRLSRELEERRANSGDFLRRLTVRDLEILRLLVAGQTLGEIADSLGVAYKTIANTCARIREKLGARSLPELIKLARTLAP